MTAYGSPGPVAGQWQPVPASAEAAVFVGREPEIASIHSALESARLVTVTGPGGVGKTQLALHAARQAATRYPDGVSFVDLSGLHDPELLPAAAAASLGLLQRLHQEAVAAAREGIGDSRFDGTFASGAACPLDQLVMHAISDADELSALSLVG